VCSFCVPTESEEGADRQALTSVDARVDDWARCQGVKGVESTGLEEVPGDGGGSGSVRAVGWSPPLPLALPSLSLSLSSPSPSTLLSVANPNDTVTTCTGHWLGARPRGYIADYCRLWRRLPPISPAPSIPILNPSIT
jgi:hypothetical protein